MTSAEAIKKVRLALCLEQNEFAELIGVTKYSVCNYEKGLRNPRFPVLRKIFSLAQKNKVKVTLEELIGQEK